MLQHAKIPDDFTLKLPSVVAHGHLYTEDDPWLYKDTDSKRWHWPYTIQNFVQGQPLAKQWKITHEEKMELAAYLGKALKVIHTLPIHTHAMYDPAKGDAWKKFTEFLKGQCKVVLDLHKSSGRLNETIMNQIMSYLPKNPISLYTDYRQHPCFLHSDMIAENVLGLKKDNVWKPVALIDFGDSMVGDPIYELIPLHIEIFQCEKQYTLEVIKHYGMEAFTGRKDFSFKAMCYTLLHAQDVFRTAFEIKPEWKNYTDLNELQKAMWDLGGI